MKLSDPGLTKGGEHKVLNSILDIRKKWIYNNTAEEQKDTSPYCFLEKLLFSNLKLLYPC